MTMGSSAPLRAAASSLAASLLLTVLSAAFGQTDEEFKAYYDDVSAGKLEEALAAGRPMLEALGAKEANARTVAQVESRLGAIERARGAAVDRLDRIAQSAESDSPDPLLYVMPQPSEMFQEIYAGRSSTPASSNGLTQRDGRFAKSYLDTALCVADAAVIDAYLTATAAKIDATGTSKARAYLTAYVVGAHDESTYQSALRQLSKATGGGLPVFLADDALNEIGRSWVAKEVVAALDNADWTRWPDGDRMRILKAVATTAADVEKDYSTALWAYGNLASAGDLEEAEGAQLAVIDIYADRLRDSRNAVSACGEYLKRFPSGKQATKVRCMRARYKYDSKDMEGALADISRIKSDYDGTNAAAYALVLEGMVYLSQGKPDEAIGAFSRVVDEYPASSFAADGIMLSGITRLQQQRYKEAQQLFQRVVDFYQDSPRAPKAKEYLKSLERIDEQPSSAGTATKR